MKHPPLSLVLTLLGSLLAMSQSAFAQSTAFTYQGRLDANGSPASGLFDFTFTLYATSNSAPSVAGPATNLAIGVSNGLFTTVVDFGPGIFAANSNWFAIAVRTNGGSTFNALLPRQQVTAAPYAIYATGAATAATATTAGTATSVPAGNVTGTLADARLSGNVALRAGGNAFTGNQTVAIGSVGVGTATPNYRLSLGGDFLNTKLALWDGGINAAGLGFTGGQFRMHLDFPSSRFSFLNAPAGVETMTLLGSGRLGIGTNNPKADLHVLGTTSFFTELLETTNTGGTWLRIMNTSIGGRDWDLISTGSANGEGTGKLLFHDSTGNATRLTLDGNGRVGMGIFNPLADFHVQGSTAYNTAIFESTDPNGSWMRLASDSLGGKDWAIVSTGPGVIEGAGHLLFYDVDTDAVRLDIAPTGHVGIGTTNPVTPLHVIGDITATGSVRVNTTNFAVASQESNLRIVRGLVNFDGTTGNGASFTVNRLSTGIYKINFQPPFPSYPIVTVTPYDSGIDTLSAKLGTLSGTSITVAIYDLGATTDSSFTFIAIGN